jgi:uncharacterized protein YbaR (Trm112 family)
MLNEIMENATRCPGCTAPMRGEPFERSPLGELLIDICYPCHAIWFDQMESAQLAPDAVITLFKKIHEHRADERQALPERLACPRCREPLRLTNDIQKNGRISYHRCDGGHGRLTTFFQFLREKNFVRNLTAKEIETIRYKVAEVRCSGCGGPIDITRDTVCSYCRAPLSVLDADAVEKTLKVLSDKQTQRTDPARIAAAIHDALVVQPARARAREMKAAGTGTSLPSVEMSFTASDLVLNGISMLVNTLTE